MSMLPLVALCKQLVAACGIWHNWRIPLKPACEKKCKHAEKLTFKFQIEKKDD